MTAAPLPEHAHPVRRSLEEVGAGLDQAPEVRLFTLPAGETGQVLRDLFAIEAKVSALKLALLAHADSPAVDVATYEAATSMLAWLRVNAALPPAQGKKLLTLAHRLERHDATRQALAAGEISAAAAGVIVAAIEAVEPLPSDSDGGEREEAERVLLGHASSGQFDTRDLARIGERIEESLNPEAAAQREAQRLARLEAEAARECHLSIWHDEHTGTSDITARVPVVTGIKLHRQIESLLNPKRPDPIALVNEKGIRIGAAERRGLALVELIDRIPATSLPTTGGCDPVIVVTMDLETLLGGLKPVVLDTGHRISPGQARRLAARHGIIPAVLGSRSEVLDLGRKVRLASKKQRLAMCLQQHGVCAVEGCDRPITWSDAHHLIPWRNGGRTDLHNMVMPCRQHHRLADHPDYRVIRLGPGRIRIIRRT